MSSNNEWVGHPTIMYCCLDAEILNIDGHWYVEETYQDGETWSDDEIFGSNLYDLENKRKLETYVYVKNAEEWKWYFEHWEWDEMDYEFEDWHLYGDAIEYYQNEINKKKMENTKVIEQEYYVIERNGQLYGEEYEDGKCHVDGFVDPYTENDWEIEAPLEKVKKLFEYDKENIENEGFGYLTYAGNEAYFCEKLKGAKIRKVKVTTTIEFLD